MKNKKAVKRLIEQGLSDQEALKVVRDIRDLGYSPETITLQMRASEIVEIIASVDRALERAFPKGGSIMLIETIVLKRRKSDEVVLKLTTEERKDGVLISTYWEPSDGHENDRFVKEHETISGALCDMYRDAIAFMGGKLLDENFEIEVNK